MDSELSRCADLMYAISSCVACAYPRSHMFTEHAPKALDLTRLRRLEYGGQTDLYMSIAPAAVCMVNSRI